LFAVLSGQAQQSFYTTANVHSHNDYEQAVPFRDAWHAGFGSIEVDIFLDANELIVAHDRSQLTRRWTIDSLYFLPLQQCINTNKGQVYADASRQLQLMIDIKTEALPTLDKLVEQLKKYPSLIQCPSLHITISGNRPAAAMFSSYPDWISFDGDFQQAYNAGELRRIAMLSDNFARYSKWNGKGRLPEKEKAVIEGLVQKAHAANKKIRLWNAPDILNAWYTYMELGIDYINTDHIHEISTFLKQLPDRSYTADSSHSLYHPLWKNDGLQKPVKNIILLVGDGTGLAQWYAGYTANKGALNVFSMRHTGLSKTSSYDNYITDSAPGATAFSSGTKTNNRAVGVDPAGKPLVLLPEIIRRRKMKTGIITSGDLRDATPAAFYAHQSERSNNKGIMQDLATAIVDVVIGACPDSLPAGVKNKFIVYSSLDDLTGTQALPVLVTDKKAAMPATGRGNWASDAFNKATRLLSGKEGFFLLLEGAQIDHGGHANKLPYTVSELLDFDKVIGKAMAFADSNGETLVIVTGDHETGGLTLTRGDYTKGFISGQFATEDHTAIPVPVFAYGPQSGLFDGVYENTAIFTKMLQALGIKQ